MTLLAATGATFTIPLIAIILLACLLAWTACRTADDPDEYRSIEEFAEMRRALAPPMDDDEGSPA